MFWQGLTIQWLLPKKKQAFRVMVVVKVCRQNQLLKIA
jgi:hypothetical protein